MEPYVCAAITDNTMMHRIPCPKRAMTPEEISRECSQIQLLEDTAERVGSPFRAEKMRVEAAERREKLAEVLECAPENIDLSAPRTTAERAAYRQHTSLRRKYNLD